MLYLDQDWQTCCLRVCLDKTVQVCLFDNSMLTSRKIMCCQQQGWCCVCGYLTGAILVPIQPPSMVRIGWCNKATRKIVELLHSWIGLKCSPGTELDSKNEHQSKLKVALAKLSAWSCADQSFSLYSWFWAKWHLVAGLHGSHITARRSLCKKQQRCGSDVQIWFHTSISKQNWDSK